MKEHNYKHHDFPEFWEDQHQIFGFEGLASGEKENNVRGYNISKAIQVSSLQKNNKSFLNRLKDETHQNFMLRQCETRKCINQMEKSLIKLGQKISNKIKYKDLFENCRESLESLKELNSHNEKKKHFSPYFQQLHSKSTQIKMHLLSMLKEQSSSKKQAELRSKILEADIEKMSGEIGELKRERECQLNQKRQLEAKLKKMQQELQSLKATKIKNKYEGNFDTLNDFNIPLIQKTKQNRNTCFNRDQMQLSDIDGQIRSVKSNHMHKSRAGIDKKQVTFGRERPNEELYRFILVQAFTIQDQILAEEQSYL